MSKYGELKLKCNYKGDNFAGYNVVSGSITMDDHNEIYHVIEYAAYEQQKIILENGIQLKIKHRDLFGHRVVINSGQSSSK